VRLGDPSIAFAPLAVKENADQARVVTSLETRKKLLVDKAAEIPEATSQVLKRASRLAEIQNRYYMPYRA